MKFLIYGLLIFAIIWMVRKSMMPGKRMTVDEARRLLEIDSTANADAIIAAHKRLIAKVHPDTGGSAELAAQVNAARDILLRNLPN
jgi:DnaJ homolog subfamily C member 19